jgi:hypothetical protein
MRGAISGLRVTYTAMDPHRIREMRIPGMTPAMKSLPMEVSVMSP